METDNIHIFKVNENFKGNFQKYDSFQNQTPELMDRSGLVRSSFIRKANDRGQTPCELVGRAYKKGLHNLLQNAAKRGTKWTNREIKSPEDQIEEQKQKYTSVIEFNLTDNEIQRIEYYLTQDIQVEDVEQLPEVIWNKVLDKMNKRYLDDKRITGVLLWLKQRAQEDWDRVSREALLREALLDPWQKERLKVRQLLPAFPHFIIKSPVPWSEEFKNIRDYCVNNLTMAKSVVVTSHPIWDKLLGDKFEILMTKQLDETRPHYYHDMKNYVETYLNNSRSRIIHYMYLCAEHMWIHRPQWENLINKEAGVNETMISLLNCFTSLMYRRLRDKTIESHQNWKNLILRINQSTEEFPVKPLLKFKFNRPSKEVIEEIELAREFIINTLTDIYKVTQNLPTVGTVMFNPDMA